jgi:hypothetical protein
MSSAGEDNKPCWVDSALSHPDRYRVSIWHKVCKYYRLPFRHANHQHLCAIAMFRMKTVVDGLIVGVPGTNPESCVYRGDYYPFVICFLCFYKYVIFQALVNLNRLT